MTLFAANALLCIVIGEENPQNVPFPWDFVSLPNEDRATAIGNVHKNLVKIASVVPEISSRTDRHTDVLITILRHRSRTNKSNKSTNPIIRGRILTAVPRKYVSCGCCHAPAGCRSFLCKARCLHQRCRKLDAVEHYGTTDSRKTPHVYRSMDSWIPSILYFIYIL